MATIFSKIVNREIPSYKVAENEKFYAFLDINPLAKGHTLVIPKKEVDYIFDLDNETYTELFSFVRKVSAAIEASIDCVRLGMVVYGLDVPHVHVHLVPLQGKGNELNFGNPKVKLSPDEFKGIAERIRTNFESA
ncbi:MAG: HIT family protein [Chlorobi bacterium]|nr:HIT family protein [Chlorobiota bacterium]